MYRYYNQGFYGNRACPGLGFFNNQWGIIAGIGIVVIIALLFILFVHNKKKRVSYEALEILKLQYVKGEISEEEYYRRKSLID